jgi:hypothetical protein
MSRRTASVLAIVAAASCGDPAPAPQTPSPDPVEVGRTPLTQMGINTYLGFQGGLYDGGTNTPPPAHAAEGRVRRTALRPLNVDGNPSATGRIILLSAGMSNTSQEFCNGSSTANNCSSFTFMGLAAADAAVNRSTLAIVNGARGGQVAESWDQPADAQYDTVRFNRLEPLGFSERQVQVVWLKLANPTPQASLPAANADARVLLARMGNVVRALKVRYPNLQMVFVSSRIYAGYATTTLNPEPHAYESGFAVRWLIDAQTRQIATGSIDPAAGNLDYRTGVAPWLAWGPYLWADGATPRQGDGLTWLPGDFQQDGTHPQRSGQEKVGLQLLAFFKTSEFTSCWFLAGQSCP